LFFFKKIEKWIKDLIFPFFCLNCQKEGSPLCLECQKKATVLNWQVCPLCEKTITEKGELCALCQKTAFPLDSLLVASDYRDPKISKSIHLLKYHFITELGPFLSKILHRALLKNNAPLPDVIIPVPLHPWRFRWRGFNQAELLANYIAKNLVPGIEIPLATDWLYRQKNTAPQRKISKAEKRKNNLENAFQLHWPNCLAGKNQRILLVDDVCTTGATLTECAKTLRKIHPKNLSAIVIARQR